MTHNLTTYILVLLALSLSSNCVTNSRAIKSSTNLSKKAAKPPPAPPRPLSSEERDRLVAIAQAAIGQTKLSLQNRLFRPDCSGLIRAIFNQAKIALGGIMKTTTDNDVKLIYRYVKKYGKILDKNPVPGDLVFFHNTYDRSGSGEMDDALTHVGLVEKVEDTRVFFVHHLGQSIIRSRMDLTKPSESRDPKSQERLNHILRKADGKYRAFTAAELFAGFGRL